MPISPTTYWMSQIVLSWWNYLWFLLLRQLPKRNVRKVTKIVSFSLIYFRFFYFFSLNQRRNVCLSPHWLLSVTFTHGYCEPVFMLLAIFFFFYIKGLKIIAVTKFSLEEIWSLSTWPGLFQVQGAICTAMWRGGRWISILLQFSIYLDDVKPLLKLIGSRGGRAASDLVQILREERALGAGRGWVPCPSGGCRRGKAVRFGLCVSPLVPGPRVPPPAPRQQCPIPVPSRRDGSLPQPGSVPAGTPQLQTGVTSCCWGGLSLSRSLPGRFLLSVCSAQM